MAGMTGLTGMTGMNDWDDWDDLDDDLSPRILAMLSDWAGGNSGSKTPLRKLTKCYNFVVSWPQENMATI